MTRAFLCHSSLDKGYLETVAQRLGRGRVVFDDLSFRPGQDFRDEIRRHLDRTALFVFFVSRRSLESAWCQFELDQAELRRMSGGIEGQLALLIDRDIDYADLPAWMSNARAIRQPRPTQAVRDIENALFALAAPEQRRPFVGRQDLSKAFTSSLLQHDYEPRILVAAGLDGIGRRSYLARVAQDALDLPVGPYMILSENAGLEDLYARLLDEVADSGSREDFARDLAAFQRLDEDNQATEVATQLGRLAEGRTVPALVDSGWALTEKDTGGFRPAWSTVFDEFTRAFPDEYLAVVKRQVPRLRDLPFEDKFLVQRVAPLTDSDVRLLLGQLLRRNDIPHLAAHLEDLAEYIGGYAPSAYFAASQANEYGLSALLADRSALVDFRARRFARFMDGLTLTEQEWLILRYLAGETAVPLGAIAVVIEADDGDVAHMLRRLIDLSVVVALDEDYALSKPISDAVVRARGLLPPSWYKALLPRVRQRYWSDDGLMPPLSLVDLTLRAVLRSGEDIGEYDDILRVSTIHDIAQESYHRREWDEAVQFGYRADRIYEARGDRRRRFDVQETLVKALSQLERYEEADAVLEDLKQASARRAWYLQSFVYRRQRRMKDAAAALDSALKVGDRSNSVYRDYADVLLRLGDRDRARQMIQVVLDRDPDNVFILDLVARIEIQGSNRGRAEAALEELQRSDVDERFIHHRRATFFQKAGEPARALDAAEKALAYPHGSAFEVHSVTADILIELGQFERFDQLMDELDASFKSSRRDVRAGLRCKGLIRRGRWEEANTVWETLGEKSQPVHRGLRAAILETKSLDSRVGLADRDDARREAEKVRQGLADPQVYFIDDDLEAEPASA